MTDRTTERISWIEGDTYFEREVDSVAVARIEHEAVAAERSRLVEVFKEHRHDPATFWRDCDECIDKYSAALDWAIQQIEQPT